MIKELIKDIKSVRMNRPLSEAPNWIQKVTLWTELILFLIILSLIFQ